MRFARFMKSKKVPIIRDNNSIVSDRDLQVIDIVRAKQPGVGRSGHVDPATTKPIRNRRINVLVKVKPDGSRHPVAPTFA